MLSDCKNLIRAFGIVRVLARHDALFFRKNLKLPVWVIFAAGCFAVRKSNKRQGQRLAEALQELGPTFIKLGQLLSTRADLIGEEIARDLALLQDNLPSFPIGAAHTIIKSEFGKEINELFREFDDKPVAAASIAQVHFATTPDGKEVAVKILRPNIELAFARDLEFLRWVARTIKRASPKYKRLKLEEVVETFADTVRVEMDLRLEAAAAAELKENFLNDTGFKVPAVDWLRTSRRVMTLERVKGIRVDNTEALIAADRDLKKITTKAAEVFFKQVFRDGFFHADMHPGNLFIDEDGAIVVVDFGIMGRIDRQTRLFLAQMLNGFLNRDYKKVAEVHFAAGYTPIHQSKELFAQACRSIGEPIFNLPQKDISIARLLAQMFKITEDFQMETQPQLLLLQKTMVQAEGLSRILHSEANFWEIIRPFAEEWGKENFGTKAKLKNAASEMMRLEKQLHNIVQVVDRLPDVITKDGLKLHPDSIKKDRPAKKELIWTIIISGIVSLAIFTLLLLFV